MHLCHLQGAFCSLQVDACTQDPYRLGLGIQAEGSFLVLLAAAVAAGRTITSVEAGLAGAKDWAAWDAAPETDSQKASSDCECADVMLCHSVHGGGNALLGLVCGEWSVMLLPVLAEAGCTASPQQYMGNVVVAESAGELLPVQEPAGLESWDWSPQSVEGLGKHPAQYDPHLGQSHVKLAPFLAFQLH